MAATIFPWREAVAIIRARNKPIRELRLFPFYERSVWTDSEMPGASIPGCRSSGKPVKTWCEENGIIVKSFYRWERLYMAESSM